MKRVLILIVCLISQLCIQAQMRLLTTSPLFYDEFKQGTVFFTEGNPVEAKFNYNLVLEEMQFIQDDEIATLTQRRNITHIEIDKDIFVPIRREGWAFVIQDGPVTLLEKRRLISDYQKGAYGVPLTTSGAQVVKNLNSMYHFVGDVAGSGPVNSEHLPRPFRVESSFWLMKDLKTHHANRRNFLRLYSEVGPQLEAFMAENDIDFRREEHLRGLTRFANGLLLKTMAKR